jgi:hypothetical protein
VTGIPTAGDIGLLGMMIQAEQTRTSVSGTEGQLASDGGYSSPFIAMPF